MRWYLVPQVDIYDEDGVYRYVTPWAFANRWNPQGYQNLGFYPYGFMGAFLVLADLSAALHTQLMAEAVQAEMDVYAFPNCTPPDFNELNATVGAGEKALISAAFDRAKIPTEWLTPGSNTYRELIRRSGQMFRFMQRYKGASLQVPALVGEGQFTVTQDEILAPDVDFTPFATVGISVYRLVVEGTRAGKPSKFFGYIAEAQDGQATIFRDKGQTNPGWNAELPFLDVMTGFWVGLASPQNLYDYVDLTTQFRQWPDLTKAIFLAAVDFYGLPAPGNNMNLTQMLRAATDNFDQTPFSVGHNGFTF